MTVAENISNTGEPLLDEVLADYLKAAQEGRAPSRQALLERHPDLAGELSDFFADQDQVERLAAPLRSLAPPPLPLGAVVGDYELIDAIAQGGMGIVYRARQQSLQRFVALKVLLAGPLASPEQMRRFQAEAEAVAALDHPNIVPVYEVGMHCQRPYFSMKLLEGGSLADRLKRNDRPNPREAAALLATVADAVHYAHERGILHRDLKPANILLDAQGQPHVSDFGLAKRAAGTAETPVPSALTVSGAIVGTPSYMAPEQAAGSHGVTTATDVYGLGTILYELLTGRPPLQGDDLFDTLRRLREEEPAAPRALNPRLDRDIETICLKCLQKEPPRRYGSARELALDLRRYLGGEPIEARPLGRLARLVRWCRRKPVAAAVTLAFVAVVATAFVLVEMARRRAVGSENDKEIERRAAAAGRDKARRMIDEICLELSGDGWGEDPIIAAKRKRMLEKGLAYYRNFLDDPDADAPARDELIRDYFRIGDLSQALGDSERALDAFHRARLAAEIILQLKPEDRTTTLWLARIHNRIALFCKNANRCADAVDSGRRAHDLLTELRRQTPGVIEVDGELAVACNTLGNSYKGMERSKDAEAAYRECIDLNRDLCRRSSDAQYSFALAVALGNLSALVHERGAKKEGRELSEEANRLLRRLDAKVPRYRQELARHLLNRGIRLNGEKRHAEAVKALTEGRDVLTHLVESQPRVLRYQYDLARLLRHLSGVYRSLGDKDKNQLERALEAAQSAWKLDRDLAEKEPRSREPIYGLAGSLFNVGLANAKLDRKTEALQAYQTARDHLRRLLKAEPDNLDYRHLLGLTLNNLGRTQWLLKHRDEALADLREALEHNRFVLDRMPQNSHRRRVLNTTFVFLTDVYRDTGQREELIAVLRARRELWPDKGNELFVIACEMARAKADDEAMRTLEQAVGKGFKDSKQMEKESALTSLRQRPDFAKLLQRSKATN